MNKFITELLNWLKSLSASLDKLLPNQPIENIDIDVPPLPKLLTSREILFETAKEYLGTDVSPNDIAPDEFGCAESVNAVYKKAFGSEIGGNISTYRMYQALIGHPFFYKIDFPLPGDIIISPTGYGGDNGIKNGHVGIVGENETIMSNSSSTGKFTSNYTISSWIARYKKLGGYPVIFFRRK